MTKSLIKSLAVYLLLNFIVACERPVCKNSNTIFDKYSPDSKEYKDELIKQLANIDKSKLTYWMDMYQEDKSSQNIHAYIQGEGICAKIVLSIDGSVKGVEEILKNKGAGYVGAGLDGLKFDIKQDSIATKFVFQEIRGIVD